MSCCGSKRKVWTDQMKRSTPAIDDDVKVIAKEKIDRTFEYVGDYARTIYGAASGRAYEFRFKGDRVSVSYYDSFAMMAERDLKSLAG
jgi:hypothetical protein